VGQGAENPADVRGLRVFYGIDKMSTPSVPPPRRGGVRGWCVAARGLTMKRLIGYSVFVIASHLVACGGNPQVKSSEEVKGGKDDGGARPTQVFGDGGVRPGTTPSAPVFVDDDPSSSDRDAGGGCDEETGLGCDFGDAGPACGDGRLDDGEECDDGNALPGDGCNGACALEPYSECDEPGEPCVSTIVCGDGEIDPGEVCDDGNDEDGDGCSSSCEQNPAYICETPGELCVLFYACGDSVVNGVERCDDGNDDAGDGCDSDCQLEDGYSCPEPGEACKPIEYCGDGVIQDGETCDDGDVVRGDDEIWNDGCSGVCTVDPFSVCEVPGEPCESLIVCGDGQRDPGEMCDDGGTADSDGCSGDCSTQATGWVCVPGQACVQLYRCGDGRVSQSTGELCDDGNTDDADGCDASCAIEPGYTCPTPNAACVVATSCGDGTKNGTEQCDDGGTDPGDGCSARCRIENDWACDANGKNCVYTVQCGDGVVSGAEVCDDGNTDPGDGCDATCANVESGYTCPRAGFACRAICGDGVVNGTEQCDDGPGTAGAPGTPVGNDGCSATCRREAGYSCPPGGGACSQTVCGDGVKAGDEGCDFGDTVAGDGCGPTCQIEPTFSSTGVPQGLACGDGLITGSEECDDGNVASNDGCSATCTVEDGWECDEVVGTPANVEMAVTYRDFKPTTATTGGHPHFEINRSSYSSRIPGIAGAVCTSAAACGTLDAERKPVKATGTFETIGGTNPAASFAQWYRDDALNDTIVGSLDLIRQPDGSYVAERNDTDDSDTDGFFPINDAGLGNSCPQFANGSAPTCCGNGASPSCRDRNYHFTTELSYFFQFQGGEELVFRGDDDVWVFINGRLAVDIGGIHTYLYGRVVLGDADSSCGAGLPSQNAPAACAPSAAELATGTDVRFGLTKGEVYEIKFFHAERRTSLSNFRLTLDGFLAPRSYCTPVCGDGIATADEECDDGTQGIEVNPPDDVFNTATPAYNSCTAGSCTLGPYCGDKVVTAGEEECDDGSNRAVWGQSGCAPGCVLPPSCGDGILDADFEECDDGAANTDTGYGGCTTDCEIGPYCGDGVENGTETCDDGINDGRYGGCTPACTPGPFCGDGTIQTDWGEECDGGDNCNPQCRVLCGNGVKDPDEECDDGVNDGSYGRCAEGCVLAPYCGDGEIQEPYETCDEGTAGNTGGYDGCSEFCQPDEYCGDGIVNGPEECDDRINDGGYLECAPGCKLGPRCGDGVVQAEWGEQCDGGDNCSKNCKLGAQCGDGVVQSDLDEECDDGVNDGGYGECAPMCKLGPRCGDGVRDPKNEQCDDGDNDGGYGECAPGCVLGPRCGDGIKNGDEQCDDGNTKNYDGCSSVCRNERGPVR